MSRWVQTPPVRMKRDVIERISHLLNIYASSHAVFGDYADQWLYVPNPAFGDRMPIELLKSGAINNLLIVRRYIDHAASI